MKKILIFYGSYGGGHFSAAKYLEEYIHKNYENYEVVLIDCIEYINKVLNKVSTKVYEGMAKNAPWMWKEVYSNSQKGTLSKISSTSNKIMAVKLKKLILEENPEFIISTHPFSSQMCSILKKKNKINCNVSTVLTDFEIHSQWLVNYDFIDNFFVAHSQMKEDMTALGVHPNKIFVTGIPLSEKFLLPYEKKSIFKRLSLDENKFTILFFAGGKMGLAKNKTYKIFEYLVRDFTNIQLIAISGKNRKIKSYFKEIINVYNKKETVKLLAYTTKVPELMYISNLVITKPGGLTTTESLASGLPILFINPIPGQEEGNARFLENKGAAIWIKKDDNIQEILNNLLNNRDKLESMKDVSISLAKKNSTKNIIDIILN